RDDTHRWGGVICSPVVWDGGWVGKMGYGRQKLLKKFLPPFPKPHPSRFKTFRLYRIPHVDFPEKKERIFSLNIFQPVLSP
ncbi:hypothetical protein, partial [Bilophila wadsworthia]